MNDIISEAFEAIKIAKVRQKPLTLLISGYPMVFKEIRDYKIESLPLIQIRGRLKDDVATGSFHQELDHWVSLDLRHVQAVIDRDHTNLAHDDDA